MGNHDVGRAMGRIAEILIKKRTHETALELLDEICQPYRGYDAEFESEDPDNLGYGHPDYLNYTDPNGPIGRLIIEAFGESSHDYMTGWPEEDAAQEAWWDGPYGKFRKRYGFV